MALAQKNKRLEVLVGEKELLLKEVHHRVKNNLHTIISLLESQAHFLSDEALMAVQQSQHRVYAMSLIHQKLYQHEQATTVKMDQYFAELLLYFKDSFELGDKISFQVQMDAVELDISEAIPIGLILNEAITNAIKYAFINRQKGIVYISLQQSGPSHIRLRISDNGVGLPPGWESKINQSLGIKLMRGLSDEIHAAFNITSDGGTSISVDFEKSSFEMNAVA